MSESPVSLGDTNRTCQSREHTELGQLRNEFAKYPIIPAEVCEYAIGCVEAGVTSPLIDALKDKPEAVLSALDRLFSDVRAILDVESTTLIKNADFQPKDLDPDRFDAMIAELRAIVFLANEGFVNLRMLRGHTVRSADMVGEHCGTRFAVEVTCSSRRSDRYDLRQYLVDRFWEKRKQLQLTANAEQCKKHLLVVVLNSYPALALLSRREYLRMLKDAHDDIGKPPHVHLALVTGREPLGEVPDDCAFPPL